MKNKVLKLIDDQMAEVQINLRCAKKNLRRTSDQDAGAVAFYQDMVEIHGAEKNSIEDMRSYFLDLAGKE